MKCRYCGAKLSNVFVDLGVTPPSNAYLTEEDLILPEKRFPLKVMVCDSCWLVQTEDHAGADELFSKDYAYFSSYSSTWLNHAKRYVDDMKDRFRLNAESNVIEVAANDGYLLQHVRDMGISCFGIEPTKGTASAAKKKGIDILEKFFGSVLARELVEQGKSADLMAANNVLAHVPDINDFVSGFAVLLKPEGVATFEFPHIMELIAKNQFDTVYHEHYSYLSLTAVDSIFRKNGLLVFDVEKLPTHGGSLRVFACRKDVSFYERIGKVNDLLAFEEEIGVKDVNYYTGFQAKADKVKADFVEFLGQAKKKNKKTVGYGAAAKGNTLMNYAGVNSALVTFVADRNPEKQGKYLPGSHIPVVDEKMLIEFRPDYVIIFPWNLREEITEQLGYIKGWGGELVTAVPCLEII
ncbi:MAG: class I SAM-dependent methyltransferase [Candidatus Omnitrophota bacterium]